MNEQRSIRDYLLLALISVTGITLLCYTAYRAYTLSFTHDESYSYLHYVRNDLFDTRDANNHLLNTLLMKFSSVLFGIGELALRLPNLLAHAIFLYYSARIVLTFKSGILIIVSFIIINLNPYLLEFFSLARGYGLSMGLMMGSLYYVYSYLLYQRQKIDMHKSLVFAALAVTANYMLLNYFLALFLMFLICEYIYACNKNSALFIKSLPLTLFVPLVSLVFVLPRILMLKDMNDAYFTGHGSWTASLTSLVDSSVYGVEYPEIVFNVIWGALIIAIGLGIAVSILNLIKGKPEKEALFLIFVVLSILFCLSASFAQNILFNTNFPRLRTALFYIPLLSLLTVLALNWLGSKTTVMKAMILIIGLLFISNASFTMNLTHTLTWRYDMNTKAAMEALSESDRKSTTLKFNKTISSPTCFMPAIDYYRDKFKMHWLNRAHDIESHNIFADYYYLEPNSLERINEQELSMMAEFSEGESKLFENTDSPQGEIINETFEDFEEVGGLIIYPKTITNTVSFSGQYSNLVRPSLPYSATYADTVFKSEFANPMIISTKMMVYPVEHDFGGEFIISCEHEGQFSFWEASDIKANIRDAKKWMPTYFTCTIPPIDTEYCILKIFFFNHGAGDVYIDDFHIKIIDPIIE